MTTEVPGASTPSPATAETEPLDLLPLFDEALRKQGGDIAVIDTGGPEQLIIVGHPLYIREVFEKPPFTEKGSAYKNVVSEVIGDGIVTSSGEKWKTHQEHLASAFRTQAVRDRVDEIAEVGNNFADDLIRRTEDGSPIDLQTEMTRLTFKTIAQFLCGKTLASIAEEHISLADLEAVFDSIRQLRGPVTEEQKRHIDQTLVKLDAASLALVQAAREQEEGETVLSKLAYARDDKTHEHWSDKAIRDELVTLLFAGHETMELSLTWLFHTLQQHPVVLAKVRQELKTVLQGAVPDATTIPQLRYLHNVVDEMWRLLPPTPFVSRSVNQEAQLGGIAVAPKDEIITSIWHAHRHSEVWESPGRAPADQFDPDRFPLTRTERQAYFPFARGERGCLGHFLARTEIAVLAPILLQRTNMQILPHTEKVSAVADLTLRPDRRLFARVGRLVIT